MKAPLPLREREGPAPKAWEGEGVRLFARRSLTLPALRASFPLPKWERGS
jgi:hypothetical protein